MKKAKSWLVACFFLATAAVRLVGQTPDCLSVICSAAVGQTGDTVCVEVSSRGFTDLVTLQFSMHWNPSVIQFISAEQGFLPTDFGDLSAEFGILRVLWFDPTTLGQNVPDGSVLFRLCFKIIGAVGSESAVYFNGSPLKIELADSNLKILKPNFISGSVAVTNDPPSQPISLEGCIVHSNCLGLNGAIDISVSGGTPPYSFLWTDNNSFTNTNQNLQNIYPGLYFLTVTDAAGATRKASFLVENKNPNSISLNVLKNPESCFPGNDGSISLALSGGSAPFSFIWNNGSTNQNLSQLTAGNYFFTATDQQGCKISEEIKIEENVGFSLATSVQSVTCEAGDSTGYIFLTVQNTSATPPFSFLWSNGSTEASLGKVPAEEYSVTVTDAHGCSQVRFEEVYKSSGTPWNPIVATDCQTNTTLGSISVWLPDVSLFYPPVVFSWSTGVVFPIDTSGDAPLVSSISGLQSGSYGVTMTDAHGCSQSVNNILLNCNPSVYLTKKCLVFTAESKTVAPISGSQICVPIRVQDFENIYSAQFALEWDTTKLGFTDVEILPNALQLSNINFGFNPNEANLLRFVWYDASVSGISLADSTPIFNVCFENKGQAGEKTWIRFVEAPPLIFEVSDELGDDIGFAGQFSQIQFENFSTAQPLQIEACATRADCANNGKSSINLSILHGKQPISYLWSGPNGFSQTQQDLQFVESGLYFLKAADQQNLAAEAVFKLPKATAQGTNCVWPGDNDDNTTVNHFDLLPLGLAFGNEGPARSTAGTIWTGYEAQNWSHETPLTKVNFQHIDADGSGNINTTDLAAIYQNWGETIFPLSTDPNLLAPDLQNPSGSAMAPIFTIPDTLEAGEAATIPIFLGKTDQPATIYGLAFSFFYDSEFVKPTSVSFQPSNTWLGSVGGDLLFVQKNFPDKGRLDIALTRVDGQPITGFGEIGAAYIVIEDDIYFRADDPWRGGPTGDTLLPTAFQISYSRAIDDQEKLLSLLEKSPAFYLHPKGVATEEPLSLAQKINLFPNPTTAEIQLSSSLFLEKCQAIGPDGRLFFENNIGSENAQIQIDGLPDGLFFLKIWTKKGIAVKRFIKKS